MATYSPAEIQEGIDFVSEMQMKLRKQISELQARIDSLEEFKHYMIKDLKLSLKEN